METGRILIVDDTPVNIELLAEMLSSRGFEVIPVKSARQALQIVEEIIPDIFLLDVHMPEINGYELCTLLKQDDALRDIPVMFISALHDAADKLRGFQVGGVDYITKPFNVYEVLARVSTHLELQSKRREVEAMQRWETDYLRQMNQLKDDVLRIASHDLKNPLSVVMGYSEMLLDRLEEDGQIGRDSGRYLEGIRRAADKMLELVHDLLDLARIEGRVDMNMESVFLTRYLRQITEDSELEAHSKGLDFEFLPPHPDIEVTLSPQRFEQVMANLLSNAIKYTPQGGTISVIAEQEINYVRIVVRDTGIGIPEDALPRLFDKFYRVQSPDHLRQTGSGLGMAIAKAIVEQHGGQIRVESQVNRGTSVIVSLPLTAAH